MTIQAERLNFFRFISHFRAVHRGAAFAKMRTTVVRKLMPEYVALFPLLQLLKSKCVLAMAKCTMF